MLYVVYSVEKLGRCSDEHQYVLSLGQVTGKLETVQIKIFISSICHLDTRYHAAAVTFAVSGVV